MCGIFGCIGKSDNKLIKKCLQDIHKRGPDDTGCFFDNENHVSLGHTRLSILDLSSAGHMPMHDTSGRYSIVYNGEVYNFQDIKEQLIKSNFHFKTNSDTEVIINAYREWGVDCVNKFRGMFAFAIYDRGDKFGPSPKNKKNIPNKPYVFFARDRFGIKPLIFTKQNSSVFFSSQLSPLINNNIIEKKINRKALADYINFGSVQQPRTIIEGADFLPAAHYMFVDINLNIKQYRYYYITSNVNKMVDLYTGKKYYELVSILRKKLETTTQYHLVSDVPVGAFLSGGLDSSAVVALMNQYSNNSIKTFSVGFNKKFEVVDELVYARKVAKQLKTDHKEIIIDENEISDIFFNFIRDIDQPSIDGINTYIVSKSTRGSAKVVLSGLGGDEIFAGYNHFKYIPLYCNKKLGLKNFIGKTIQNLKPNRFTQHNEFINESIETAAMLNRKIMRGNLNKKVTINDYDYHWIENENLTDLQRISVCELDNYLKNTLLRDADVTSMAHSLEVRPILLDHVLVEHVLAFPDNSKIRNGIKKSIFIDAVKDLIPEECWNRKKSGFEMPFISWMNNDLWEELNRSVNSEIAESIFTPNYLKIIKNNVKNKTIPKKYWNYLTLLSWINNNNISL